MPHRITSSSEALLNQRVEAQQQGAWSDELTFHPRVFCQLALPYVTPRGNPPVWVRRNGPFVLQVRPRFEAKPDGSYMPAYPSGTVPRLLITWIATEVTRQREWEQSPVLTLGDNLSDFIRRIGLGYATGGKNGTITRLRQNSVRLFDAVISAEWEGDPNRDVGKNFLIAEEKNLWWPDGDRNDAQQSLLPSTITLSNTFYRELREHSVPLSFVAMRWLQQFGPQTLDVYTWLCHRLPRMEQHRSDISWAQLRAQFGSNVADTRQGRHTFQKRFEASLKEVLKLYTSAKVAPNEHGLTLWRSPAHVERKPSRRALGKNATS